MPSDLHACDFLSQVEDESIQQEARNLLSSYSQVYDVLSESIQNAVDAVDERYAQNHATSISRIHVEFNAQQRSIAVTDTGTGMPWRILSHALSPNVTFKQQSTSSDTWRKRSRGEKGVGLSFLTFGCNRFCVKTCDGNATIEAVVTGAHDWIHGNSNTKPMLVPSGIEPGPVTFQLGSPTYTYVEMQDIRTQDYTDADIFALSFAELKYVLRTRTAVGNTDQLTLGKLPVPDIAVTLVYTSKDGERNECTLPYRFLPPEEYLDPSSIISFEKFEDLQRRNKIALAHGKALVYRKPQTTVGGRIIDCYAFAMAPKAFEDLTIDRKLADGWAPESWSGIYVASRGMPTGIMVERPQTGAAGYWPRIFMLLQDDQLKFDVGRKTLQGQAKPMMQGIARKVWDDIIPYLQQLTPADSESVVRQNDQQRLDLFNQAEFDWPKLGFPYVQMLNEPQREQMVVALFYELVGAKLLKGYRTLRNNTYDQYDAFVLYTIDKKDIGKVEAASVKGETLTTRIIVEFKLDGESIIKDIAANSKRYRDINLLVCWQLGEQVFEKAGITVDHVSPDSVYYYGTTHMLFFPGFYQVGERLAVIELRTLINNLKE